MINKKRIDKQCVSILDKNQYCVIDDFCYNEYPSICEWKNGILSTTMLYVITTTPFTSDKPAIQVLVCESNPLNIECPAEHSIYVFKAFYGRTENNICGSSWSTECNYDNATASLRNRLIGYQSISNHNLTSGFVGDNPCYGVSKYAIIDYLCIQNDEFKPVLLPCEKWMNTVDFKRVDGLVNQCICQNNLIVSWDQITDCEPIQTTFFYYEGFVTGLDSFDTTTNKSLKGTTTTTTTNTGNSHGKCVKNAGK